MIAMYSTAILLILYLAITTPTSGQEDIQCAQELCRPCRALCEDDTILDITTIFRYPVRISDSRQFEYNFSPCEGITHCSETQTFAAAVCQTSIEGTGNWSLGSMLYVNWFLNQTYPYNNFVIEYLHGDQVFGVYRKTRVIFVEDPTIDPAVLLFVTETPVLEYIFEVRGRNIGRKKQFPLLKDNNKKTLQCSI